MHVSAAVRFIPSPPSPNVKRGEMLMRDKTTGTSRQKEYENIGIAIEFVDCNLAIHDLHCNNISNNNTQHSQRDTVP
jgi:hypothetical protein